MDERKIVIEGDRVIVLKNVVEKSISLESFVNHICEKNYVIETKQLPVNCVKYDKTEKAERYFIHIPEDNYKFNYNGKLYIVRIPHTILIFTFKLDSMEHAKSPMMLWTDDVELNLKSDNFFIPLLHNIYHHGGICAGTSVGNVNTQRDYVNTYLKNFFTTDFNDDLSSGKRSMKNVSNDQREYINRTTDQHELIQFWWSTLIHQNINGREIFVISKPMHEIKKGVIDDFYKDQR